MKSPKVHQMLLVKWPQVTNDQGWDNAETEKDTYGNKITRYTRPQCAFKEYLYYFKHIAISPARANICIRFNCAFLIMSLALYHHEKQQDCVVLSSSRKMASRNL